MILSGILPSRGVTALAAGGGTMAWRLASATARSSPRDDVSVSPGEGASYQPVDRDFVMSLTSVACSCWRSAPR